MKSFVTTVFTLLLLITNHFLSAQSTIKDVLRDIEQNNSSLKALQQQVEAEKLNNRTGIYLANPEVDFNYLFSSPKAAGNQNNLTVMQSFNMATLSGSRSKLAEQQNVRVDLQFKANRLDVLAEAWQYLNEYIYNNSLQQQLQTRLDHAKTIAEVYKRRMELGDANALELNKAQLNLSMIEGEIANTIVEKTAMASHLKRLNGGQDVNLNMIAYDPNALPPNFESWFEIAQEKNPVLALAKQEIVVAEQQVKVNKATGLPNFSAGYLHEKTQDQTLNGVQVGVSIPLWENKNRVRQARVAVMAAEELERNTRVHFYHQLQTWYSKAVGLQKTAAAYRKSLEKNNSLDLLAKALNAGQISLLEYIMELSIYYDNVNKTLEAERDYQQALTQLRIVEM